MQGKNRLFSLGRIFNCEYVIYSRKHDFRIHDIIHWTSKFVGYNSKYTFASSDSSVTDCHRTNGQKEHIMIEITNILFKCHSIG